MIPPLTVIDCARAAWYPSVGLTVRRPTGRQILFKGSCGRWILEVFPWLGRDGWAEKNGGVVSIYHLKLEKVPKRVKNGGRFCRGALESPIKLPHET